MPKTKKNRKMAQAPAMVQTAKKDLSHLIGRPLVPFFLPDSQEENTSLKQVATDLDFSVDDSGGALNVPVREFQDGYFVDPEARSAKRSSSPSNKGRNKTPNRRSKQRQLEQSSEATLKQTPSNRKAKQKQQNTTSAADNPQFWASGTFTSAPSPHGLPLPQFLAFSPKGQSAETKTEALSVVQSETKVPSKPSMKKVVKLYLLERTATGVRPKTVVVESTGKRSSGKRRKRKTSRRQSSTSATQDMLLSHASKGDLPMATSADAQLKQMSNGLKKLLSIA